MATLSDSIRVYDNFSLSLIEARQNMKGAMTDAQKLNQILWSGFDNLDSVMNKAFTKIGDRAERLVQVVENMNEKLEAGAKKSGGMLDKIKEKASLVFNLDNAKQLGKITVEQTMEQQKRKDMFITRTGNEDLGTAMFKRFKGEALALGADVNEYLSSSLTFMSVTKDADQITRLNKIANKLATFDPDNQGLKANGMAVKQALSGDNNSLALLAQRFGMSQKQVDELKLDEIAEKGDYNGFIASLEKLLEQNNMGDPAYKKMLDSPVEQVSTLKNNINNAFAESGQSAFFTALLPVVRMLNKAFENNEFQPFIDALSQGLGWVAQNAYGVLKIVADIFGFISANWPTLGPIIWGIVGAIAAWAVISKIQAFAQVIQAVATGVVTFGIILQTIATHGLAGAWKILNTAMKANIFILIASLIVGLIVWLVELWQTNDDFVAAVVGGWNVIMDLFDKVKIFHAEVIVGILSMFISYGAQIKQFIQDIYNSCVDVINELIDEANKIPGVRIDFRLQPTNFADDAADLAKKAKEKGAALVENMKTEAARKSEERAENLKKMMADRKANRNPPNNLAGDKADMDKYLNMANPQDSPFDTTKTMGAANTPKSIVPTNIPRVDEVGTIGQINDTVEVASEDLEVMRDLAEIQSIQNFVTLTPTVQVTTGDIHQPTDANEMIRRIEEVMSREIANSAQGVYA
ncbi:hypothetical protein AV654_21180 [Paenibacillus elgii]|uniref:Uncharacterized protein n=1 Tax=Paenibacillus elgii TaxID=189691 RepID=A0A163XAJ4_9BACL|nr:hypothetical protein [Paenibacillus elgii]KZE77590.1 hypothetical protein AV654_21180 [Paenibacillus elgii]